MSVTVAPELVHERHLHDRARRDGLRKQLVDIFYVHVDCESGCFSTGCERATPLRKLVIQHDNRIANLQGSMHHFTAGSVADVQDLRIQRLLVEFDCACRIAHCDVRCEGVKAFRNWFYFVGHGASIKIGIRNVKVGTDKKSLLSTRDPVQPANQLTRAPSKWRRASPPVFSSQANGDACRSICYLLCSFAVISLWLCGSVVRSPVQKNFVTPSSSTTT